MSTQYQSIPCPMCGRKVIRVIQWTGPVTMIANLQTGSGKPHRCPVQKAAMAERYGKKSPFRAPHTEET